MGIFIRGGDGLAEKEHHPHPLAEDGESPLPSRERGVLAVNLCNLPQMGNFGAAHATLALQKPLQGD